MITKLPVLFPSPNMTHPKCVWFLYLWMTCANPNVIEEIFSTFFDEEPKVCYVSIGSGPFDNNRNLFRKSVNEIWRLDEKSNRTCLGHKNFVIFDNSRNLSKTMNDLYPSIPSLSKILIISRTKRHIARTRELRNVVLRKNWDLLVYQEDRTENLSAQPLHPVFTSNIMVCAPSTTLQCARKASDISLFTLNRPHSSPEEVLRSLNRPLRVTTLQNPPYTIVSDDDVTTGVEVEILRIIFGCPIEFKVLSKKSLAKLSVYENPWKNISEELCQVDGGSDLAVSSLWMRKYDHDITHPIGQQCIGFIVKRPVLYSEDTFVFQSLSFEVWCINFVILAFMVALLLTIQSGLFPDHEKGKTILDVVRTFAGSSMPRDLPGNHTLLRIILLLWLVFCLIMVTSFNAGLTTSLKFPKLTKEIRTFEDILEQNINWMDETDGVSEFISTSNDATSKHLLKLYETEPNKTYRNFKLSQKNYAFRIDNQGGYVRNVDGLDETVLDGFQIVHGCYANVHMVMGLKLDSPFKGFLDERILWVNQHGFLDRWYGKFAIMRRSAAMFRLFSPNSGERQETLDLRKMKGGFILLSLGLTIGTAVFGCEIRRSKKLPGRRKKFT